MASFHGKSITFAVEKLRKGHIMTTKAFENIMSQIFEQAKETGNCNVIITLKSGETFNFNTGDNEEMVPESCELNGVVQIFGEDDFGTAWIEVAEIAAIQI